MLVLPAGLQDHGECCRTGACGCNVLTLPREVAMAKHTPRSSKRAEPSRAFERIDKPHLRGAAFMRRLDIAQYWIDNRAKLER